MAESENSADIKVEETVKSEEESKANSESKKEDSDENAETKPNRPSIDEEDIPDSFFDDFSNNEFMDGLNVLDSWDENQTQKKKDDGKKTESERRDRPDHGRYNKSIIEKDEGRYRRDFSPRRSPLRRGRSPLVRRGRSPYSRSRSRSRHLSVSPRRRRSRSRPTNSPRRGRYCLSPFRGRDYSPNHRRRDRSPYRARVSMDRDRHRRKSPPLRSREKVEELRRDPNKTRSDIEKDKDKCLRYKEAKEVEKKVIVAESGLCPPGMEDMIDELNNSSFKSKEIDPLTLKISHEKDVQRSKSSMEHSRYPQTSKQTDALTIKFIAEKEIEKSMERERLDHNQEHRDLRDILRQRLGRKDRTPPHDKSRHSPDERSNRNRHSPLRSRHDLSSSYRLGRREVSPGSNISDREVWLRELDRSEQKRRKRSPFLHELARTLCNKESIAQKYDPVTNQITFNPFSSESVSYNPQNMGQYGNVPQQMFEHPVQQPMLHQPVHPMTPMNNGNYNFQPESFPPQQYPVQQQFQPVPQFQQLPPGPFEAPVPQPLMQQVLQPFQSQQFQPVPHPFQSFGDAAPSPNQIIPGGGALQPPLPPPQVYTDIQPNNTKDILSPSAQKLQLSGRNWSNLKDISKNQQTLQLSKLFEDKKISLSDFLTVSAKGETVPCNIQEKIKVISRCQDAIKALDTTKKSSRFFPTIVGSSSDFDRDNNKLIGKWKSPLKKMAVVKFTFTTPSKGREHEVQNSMKKLLATINLRDQVVTPPPPRIHKTSEIPSILSPDVQVKDIFMQTDPYVCQICDIRNSRKFMDMATQTSNASCLDEATQVLPSDLPAPPPPRGILKNSNYPSLSHLTAAQLREQDKSRNHTESNNSGQFSPGQFNQSPVKNRPIFDSHLDTPEQVFNPFSGSASQIQNNMWPSWKDNPLQKPNPSAAIGGGNINQNMPSWKQNQKSIGPIGVPPNLLPNPSSIASWKKSMPNANMAQKPNPPWMSALTTPPNKRNQNRGFKNKKNNSNNVDLTK